MLKGDVINYMHIQSWLDQLAGVGWDICRS